MKKLLSLLTCISLIFALFSIFPQTSFAAASGTCGDNLTWTLDDEGTLTVSGTGEMPDFGWEGSPWQNNKNVKTVIIESGVTSIGERAFYNCTSLTSVDTHFGFKSIGWQAFYGCTSLESVSIPDSIQSVRGGAFYGCESLVYNICNDIKYLGNESNPYVALVEPINNDVVVCSVVIGTKIICDYAFYDCKRLCGITIADSVISIGSAAFLGCASMKSITIPDSVMSIGSSVFGVCTSLTSITIPDGVTTIGNYAFSGCDSLEIINVDAENTVYHSDNNCLIETETKTLISGCQNSIIPSDGSVTSIGEGAFSGCGPLESIIIPDSVMSIENSAFSGCNSLTSVTIGKDVTSIGSSAFEYCASLTSVTLPDSVTTIESGAFRNCTSLTSITISDSVTSIVASAFDGCTSLTSLTIGKGVTSIDDFSFYNCSSLKDIYYTGTEEEWNNIFISEYGNEPLLNAEIHYNYVPELLSGTCGDNLTWTLDNDGLLIISGTGDMYDYNPFDNDKRSPWVDYDVKNVKLPYGMTSIGELAFSNCDLITYISIPETVTSIGYCAFEHCTSLTSIEIPKNVKAIEVTAFLGCNSVEKITVDEENHFFHSENNCLIETNAKTLVAGCKNSSIPTDGSVTSIGDSAFYQCSSLISISIPDSVVHIGSFAFYNCSSLTSITIPDSVTSIGSYAFSVCDSLTSITIPDSVMTIGYEAFSFCTLLTSISIPNNVTTISDHTFYDCASLSSITIPKNIKSIEASAFYGCSSMTNVYYSGSEEDWNEIEIGKYNDPLLNAEIHYNYVPGFELKSDGVILVTDDATLSDAVLIVETVSDGGALDEVPDGFSNVALFDIHVEKDGVEVQPEGSVTVKIPVPAGMNGARCKVFHITGGAAVDMGAEYEDGYLVFTTDHFSYYAIAEQSGEQGDLNGDGEVTVKDVLVMRRFIAGLEELDDAAVATGDMNGDGELTVKDVLKARRVIAGLD